jgi:hypothetical protein
MLMDAPCLSAKIALKLVAADVVVEEAAVDVGVDTAVVVEVNLKMCPNHCRPSSAPLVLFI